MLVLYECVGNLDVGVRKRADWHANLEKLDTPDFKFATLSSVSRAYFGPYMYIYIYIYICM